MSEYIHKSHNVTVLLYHLVFPAKYRRAVFDAEVDETLRDGYFASSVGRHGDEDTIKKAGTRIPSITRR